MNQNNVFATMQNIKDLGDITGNYFMKKVEIDCNTGKPINYDPNLIFIGCGD